MFWNAIALARDWTSSKSLLFLHFKSNGKRKMSYRFQTILLPKTHQGDRHVVFPCLVFCFQISDYLQLFTITHYHHWVVNASEFYLHLYTITHSPSPLYMYALEQLIGIVFSPYSLQNTVNKSLSAYLNSFSCYLSHFSQNRFFWSFTKQICSTCTVLDYLYISMIVFWRLTQSSEHQANPYQINYSSFLKLTQTAVKLSHLNQKRSKQNLAN